MEIFLNLRQKKKFDLIVSSMSFQWFKDLKKLFSHSFKLLKENGDLAFSIPINGTFKELIFSLKRSTNRKDIPVLKFPSKEKIKNSLLKSGFKILSIKEKIIKRYYPSCWSFMKRLKTTGTNFPSSKPLTPLELRDTINYYERFFKTDKGIYATWQILFVFARRPK